MYEIILLSYDISFLQFPLLYHGIPIEGAFGNDLINFMDTQISHKVIYLMAEFLTDSQITN